MKIIKLEECIKKNKFSLFSFDSSTSTMDDAKNIINLNNNNLILISKKQTKGRGRLGNKWSSPPGNIYCSTALVIDSKKINYFLFSMMSCIAIKHSLEHIGLKDINFKWPNDIYCNNRKIAGIIQESYLNSKNNKILIIGVGINYSSSPKIKKYETTYIRKYIKNVSLKKYFEIYVNYFLNYYNEFFLKKNIFFINEFKKNIMFLGHNIKIKVNQKKIISGKFIGLKNDGSLILVKNKEKKIIYSGQILN
tara:strand:- start:542 stop:1291 length:750 start_codon:yes stop_codon:yes gene_type:complete